MKKYATTITQKQTPAGILREAHRIEFLRENAFRGRWEVSASINLTTSETWDEFGLTYAERMFLQKQQIPSGHILLPQYAVMVKQWKVQRDEWRFVDFVLFRKGDLSPIIAFEIDGDSHDGRMVFDALRDMEIYEQIACPIVHIANSKLQTKKIYSYVEHWHSKLIR